MYRARAPRGRGPRGLQAGVPGSSRRGFERRAPRPGRIAWRRLVRPPFAAPSDSQCPGQPRRPEHRQGNSSRFITSPSRPAGRAAHVPAPAV